MQGLYTTCTQLAEQKTSVSEVSSAQNITAAVKFCLIALTYIDCQHISFTPCASVASSRNTRKTTSWLARARGGILPALPAVQACRTGSTGFNLELGSLWLSRLSSDLNLVWQSSQLMAVCVALADVHYFTDRVVCGQRADIDVKASAAVRTRATTEGMLH